MSVANDRLRKRKRRSNFDRPEVDVTIRTSLFALYALVAGAAALSFICSSDFIYESIYGRLIEMRASPWCVIYTSFTAITVTSLIVGFLQWRFLPGKGPNGVPNLKVFYTLENVKLSFRQVLINFICGILSLGGGTSLGREGPTVFAGGAVAAACADSLGMSAPRRRLACVAGAAAGLAAAFNTPIAAVMFVIEAITDRFNGRQMGGILISSVIGAGVSWIVLGRHPAFEFVPELSNLSVTDYLLVPLCAFLAAMTGGLFHKLILRVRQSAKAQKRVSPLFKPLVGGMLVWVIAISTFLMTYSLGDPRMGIFGMGFGDLEDALNGKVVWYIALILLAAKLAATGLACAWGCSGGIFAPTLFLGAMVGLIISGIARLLGAEPGAHGTLLLALVGMSSCFGTVIRTPITAMLIVFEMTSRYEIVPPLMITTVISQAYAYYFGNKLSIYDAIIRQDGITLPNR